MKRGKITLQYIAKKLGYSVSTISRALSDKPGISEVVKSEIRIKALELGYDLKNMQKRSKTRGKSDVQCISIVITRDNFLDENFFRKIIREIEHELYCRKIEINFSIIDPGNDDAVYHMLKKLKPDGAILFGLVPNKSITEAAFSGLPIVLVDTPNTRILKVDRITINNYLGCYEAVSFLLQKGHQNISFFGDRSFSDNMEERYSGCKDCVENNGGIWVEADRIVKLKASGQIMIDEIKLKSLLESENAPTAVVCANDKTAFELYDSLKNLGLSVPNDLSVVGFDNAENCDKVNPPLTSVNVPKYEMGKEAVRMLLARIEDRNKATSLLRLDTEFMIRDSVINIKKEG